MRRRHRVSSHSRRRYGRMARPGSYEFGQYRNYSLRIHTGAHGVQVDILKRGFVEASSTAATRTTAIDKAKRIVDAMHGD